MCEVTMWNQVGGTVGRISNAHTGISSVVASFALFLTALRCMCISNMERCREIAPKLIESWHIAEAFADNVSE